jgi:hypothetical protein
MEAWVLAESVDKVIKKMSEESPSHTPGFSPEAL